MKKLLALPHERRESTCYINGLYDILKWSGGNYEYFLLPIIGGMSGFAYLKFKSAKPPFMVYWGNNPKYLFEELSDIIGYKEEVSEDKSWKTIFKKLKESIDNNEPVVAGALDMYYLHYYKELYNKIHVPIHYILIVGYDEAEKFYVHDCSYNGVQEISYADLMNSLNVKVPGMSRKNTIRIFKLPTNLPDEFKVAKKGFKHKSERMLNPPVSILGIPAMRKLSRDIATWGDKECFEHMVAYAGLTPPLVPSDMNNCNGLRFEEANVFERLGNKYNIADWVRAGVLFRKSGELIIELCKNAVKYEGKACSKLLKDIADIEEEAYQLL